MVEVDDIINNRRNQAEKDRERNLLTGGIIDGFDKVSGKHSQNLANEINKGISQIKPAPANHDGDVSISVGIKGAPELTQQIGILAKTVADVTSSLTNYVTKLPQNQKPDFSEVTRALSNIKLPNYPDKIDIGNIGDVENLFKNLANSLNNTKQTSVSIPDTFTIANLDNIEKLLTQLSKDLVGLNKETPKQDLTPITRGLKAVESAINNMIFPVAGGGGGATTQYTNGDVQPVGGAIVGNAIVFDSNSVMTAVSATSPFPVTVTGGGSTANASVGLTNATAPTSATEIGAIDSGGKLQGASSSNPLPVNIVSGGGSGFSVTDEAAWTAGTSALVPAGGVYNDSATALTSGQQGTFRATTNRALHSNLRNSAGTEIGTSTTPIQVSLANTASNATPVSVTAAQGTAANLNATVVGTGTFAVQATQSGSWSVTANAGTNLNTSALALETGGNLAAIKADTDKIPSQGQALAAASMPVVLTAAQLTTLTPPAAITGYSTSANQTNASQKTQIVDGSGSVIGSTSNALNVAITAGGGGSVTQGTSPWIVAGGGTAGTPGTAVLTVQGIASGTAQPISGTVTANAGTNLNTSALALESGGNLATIATDVAPLVTSGGGGYVRQDSTATIAKESGGNLATIAGTIAATAGTLPTSAVLVGMGSATSSSKIVALQSIGGAGRTGAGGTLIHATALYTYNGTTYDATSNAKQAGGTAGVGILAAGVLAYDGTNFQDITTNSTTTSSKYGMDTNILSILGTAPTTAGFIDVKGADGNVFVRQATASNLNATVVNGGTFAVQQTPATSGGISSYATGSIGNTATAVKTSAGQVYSYYFFNSNSSVAYVQFFNLATGSVTVGTTAPLLSFGIPSLGAANLEIDPGWAFSTAITIAITTTRAGGTSPSNTVDYNIMYK